MADKNDLNFTKEKIAEMSTWQFFDGFTATTCGGCLKLLMYQWGRVGSVSAESIISFRGITIKYPTMRQIWDHRWRLYRRVMPLPKRRRNDDTNL